MKMNINLSQHFGPLYAAVGAVDDISSDVESNFEDDSESQSALLACMKMLQLNHKEEDRLFLMERLAEVRGVI